MSTFRFLAFACISLGGCAAHQNIPSIAELMSRDIGQNGRACLRVQDIQGYGVRDKVINIDTTRGYYIATVHPSCIDLTTAPRLVFTGNFTEICGGRMDKIATDESYCTINEVFAFDNREAAFEAYQKAKEAHTALQVEEP